MDKLLLLNLKHNIISNIQAYAEPLKGRSNILVAPPHPLLALFEHHLPGQIVAQTLDSTPIGSFTGAVGAELLSRLNVYYTLLGHYETKKAGLTQASIEASYEAAVKNNITPILCCGSPHPETMQDFLMAQLEFLKSYKLATFYIAYEPWWAIGQPDSLNDHQHLFDAYCFIKEILPLESKVKFFYGGGLTLDSLPTILEKPFVSGALLGKLSLNHDWLHAILAIVDEMIRSPA